MTTPGTASTSDARKRKAEREAEQPVLPDKWIDGDVIRHCDRNQGTWVRTGRKWHNCERSDTGRVFDDDWATRVIVNGHGKVLHANRESAVASLPPVPAPVWSVISTDRDQPTLAKVTWAGGKLGGTFTGSLVVHEETGQIALALGGGYTVLAIALDLITHVEVLTVCPETQVPVDRSLIEEAARRVAWWDDGEGVSSDSMLSVAIVRSLAALAEGSKS